jgi:hypothetical protein
MRLLIIRPFTCLLTSTPTARLVTFQITPVRPWYTLCGIPCAAARATPEQPLAPLQAAPAGRGAACRRTLDSPFALALLGARANP